jgi:zinc protease
VPKKTVPQVQQPAKNTVYLLDRPGSEQSVIFGAQLAPPRNDPDAVPLELVNDIFGGTFSSRINMNLREDKHWSYGAFTFIWAARGQRPFIAYAPVQTDKTSESLIELDKELRAIVGKQPITDAELSKAQQNQTLQLPGTWETIGAVGESISEIVTFGLPDDYFTTYPEKVRALSINELAKAAEKVVNPDQLLWVVVGDRAKIEPGLRQLGWGEIQLLDPDGNPAK